MFSSAPQYPTPEEKAEMDARSVYVGNVSAQCISFLTAHKSALTGNELMVLTLCLQVDYQSTAEELGQHFQACGPINRVTILCDKFTGSPKG